MADIPILTEREENPLTETSKIIESFSSTIKELIDEIKTLKKPNPQPNPQEISSNKSELPSKEANKKTQEQVWEESYLKRTVDGIKSSFTKMEDVTRKNSQEFTKQLATNLAGPFNLLLKPMTEFFGIDIFEWLFKKDESVKPKESSLLKDGGAIGAAMVWFKRSQDEDEEDKKGILGFLQGLLGSIGKFLGPLFKALGLGALIAGIAWAIIDGISGYFLSDEWGVSKVSGILGGIFGGTGQGIKGAFANAGKWALIGVGVGFFAGGPLGAIAGGILGAVFGGILGYVGGKNLAKSFDMIGANIQ
ncbi:MAG: hypothetical protein GF311_28270, partial [Candidatus Lokiarchaeota archaeon]|nr:hypothetical protein [Candidatus Lokiarchaeota archaeon]